MPASPTPANPVPSPPEAPRTCRAGCAACCTAPSISSPIPGMPQGKPAGVPCVQLDGDGRCRIFGRSERPAVCRSLQPTAEMCGDSREQAMSWLARLESATAPPAMSPPAAVPGQPAAATAAPVRG